MSKTYPITIRQKDLLCLVQAVLLNKSLQQSSVLMFFFHVKYFAFLLTYCRYFLGICLSHLSPGRQVPLWSHGEGSFKTQKYWILNDGYWNNTWLQLHEEWQWTQSATLKKYLSKLYCHCYWQTDSGKVLWLLLSMFLVTWTDSHWEFVLKEHFLTICLRKVYRDPHGKQSLT